MNDWVFTLIAKLMGKTKAEVCREWHSIIIGWADTLSFGRAPMIFPNAHSCAEMEQEYHYYAGGRGAGILTWVIIVIILGKVFL